MNPGEAIGGFHSVLRGYQRVGWRKGWAGRKPKEKGARVADLQEPPCNRPGGRRGRALLPGGPRARGGAGFVSILKMTARAEPPGSARSRRPGGSAPPADIEFTVPSPSSWASVGL